MTAQEPQSEPKALAQITLPRESDLVEHTVWEKCWTREECISIPIYGEKCWSATACVRIVEESGQWFVELEIGGHSVRHRLTAAVFTYEWGIARVRVTISEVASDFSYIVLAVELCIGVSWHGVNLEKCWPVYEQKVHFKRMTTSEVLGLSDAEMLYRRTAEAGFEYAFWEANPALEGSEGCCGAGCSVR